MSNDHAGKRIDTAAIVAMVQNGSIERDDLMELCRFVSDALREPVVTQDPAPDQMIYYTINPDPPSLAERLKENREREKLKALNASAASIIAMSAPPNYPLRNTAAQDIRNLLEKRDRMEALTAEWVAIPYTGNVGQSEHLFDPG